MSEGCRVSIDTETLTGLGKKNSGKHRYTRSAQSILTGDEGHEGIFGE